MSHISFTVSLFFHDIFLYQRFMKNTLLHNTNTLVTIYRLLLPTLIRFHSIIHGKSDRYDKVIMFTSSLIALCHYANSLLMNTLMSCVFYVCGMFLTDEITLIVIMLL